MRGLNRPLGEFGILCDHATQCMGKTILYGATTVQDIINLSNICAIISSTQRWLLLVVGFDLGNTNIAKIQNFLQKKSLDQKSLEPYRMSKTRKTFTYHKN